MTPGDAEQFAEFVTSLDIDEVPASTVDRAGLIVADTFGAMIGGVDTPEVTDLASQLSQTYPGNGTILGRQDRTIHPYAAMVNGTGGTVLELDEGHKVAAGHPAIHVLPSLLAASEQRGGVSGSTFVAAIVAGYEVAARLGAASQPLAAGYHPHGIWGVVGAVAGIARLLELDVQPTTEAIAMASNHSQHTRFEAATAGRTIRNTYAGMVAPDAMAVVAQAQAGFTGLDDGLALHLEGTTADGLDRIDVDSLGRRWETDHGYFKRHAACRYTHPSIDAIDQLSTEGVAFDTGIERIQVETYPAAAALDNPAPESPLAARFSLPFAIATRLHHGHAGKIAFEQEAITREVLDLAAAVDVEATDEFAEAVPEQRGSRVSVTLSDGTIHTATVPHAKGGSERPLTRDELEEKFAELVVPVLGSNQAEELWEATTSLPATDTGTLLDLAVPSSRA